MAKTGLARTSVSRHLEYLKAAGLIYISGWERSINGGAPYPVYSLGNSPDAKYQKQPRLKQYTSAEALQKQREAKVMAEQRSIEMRSFSRGASYRNWPVMAAFYGAMA